MGTLQYLQVLQITLTCRSNSASQIAPGKIVLRNNIHAAGKFRRGRQARGRVATAITAHLVALIVVLLSSGPAHALPSVARQTGMPCSQCHTVAYGPALTAYGREFKLNGYVWGDVSPPIPPLALMVQGGFTHTSKDQVDIPAPHSGTNDNFSVDQVSAFYGGRITNSVGAFVQATFSGPDRHTHWDNLDVRFAHSITTGNHSVVFGVSVNNNPTVQDLWNSTPAWGFPYITSALAPTPAARPVISGGLAQSVLGATAYAMIDDHLYLEAGGYRGLSNAWLSRTGIGADANPHIDGVAPYWRGTWQMDLGAQYFSAGVFGLNTKLHPDPTLEHGESGRELHISANVVHQHRAIQHHRQHRHGTVFAGSGLGESHRLAGQPRLHTAARIHTVRKARFLCPAMAEPARGIAVHGLYTLQRYRDELRRIRPRRLG
jgi:hypothetical protein